MKVRIPLSILENVLNIAALVAASGAMPTDRQRADDGSGRWWTQKNGGGGSMVVDLNPIQNDFWAYYNDIKKDGQEWVEIFFFARYFTDWNQTMCDLIAKRFAIYGAKIVEECDTYQQ